ncbi:MAG: hypothetical protein SXG53_25585, partial [Pseudomonadota bacterium]|nr:hypothetical protein [Pseudomonadota bacterium]
MSSSGIDRAFERRLATLINTREPRVLQNGLKGVEKESLRVSPDGHIEHSPHPIALGSALSHLGDPIHGLAQRRDPAAAGAARSLLRRRRSPGDRGDHLTVA